MQIVKTICIKCQILFSGKNKKNITNLLSVELSAESGKGYRKESAPKGDILHIRSMPVCQEKIRKNISKCHLLKFLPSMLQMERSFHLPNQNMMQNFC